jgi:hypothetical protein
MDLDTMAAKLYGDSGPVGSTSSRAAPQRSSDADEVAQILFGNQIEPQQRETDSTAGTSVSELTDQELADRLHTTSLHVDAAREIEREALEQLVTPEDATEIAREWGQVFDRVGLTPSESALITQAAAGIVARGGAAPELIQSWSETSRDVVLQEAGGAANAAAVLADAQRLVAGVPGLRDVLDATGLGSHPVIVRAAIQAAKRARSSGKLRG